MLSPKQITWHAEAEKNYQQHVVKHQVKSADAKNTLPESNLIALRKMTTETIAICKSQRIPEGFVIIGCTTNFACSNELNNAWIIKKAGEFESICKESPIPKGYVIVRQTTNFSCSTDLENAWKIKIPEDNEVVCQSSPIPEGYVIIGQTTSFFCSSELNNAWVIKSI